MSKVTKLEVAVADWRRVLNCARRTVGKPAINKEPSDAFKRQILLAEHSPIRLLEYDFTWEEIKQWVTTHFVRHHEGIEKFVHSQRPENRPEVIDRDALPQGSENDMDVACNAQAFINISRKRLCKGRPSKDTREAWEQVIAYLRTIDPILAEKCVPECLYRGFCPEGKKCCGYVNTKEYQKALIEYRKM